jgi:hypothetical protein
MVRILKFIQLALYVIIIAVAIIAAFPAIFNDTLIFKVLSRFGLGNFGLIVVILTLMIKLLREYFTSKEEFKIKRLNSFSIFIFVITVLVVTYALYRLKTITIFNMVLFI